MGVVLTNLSKEISSCIKKCLRIHLIAREHGNVSQLNSFKENTINVRQSLGSEWHCQISLQDFSMH